MYREHLSIGLWLHQAGEEPGVKFILPDGQSISFHSRCGETSALARTGASPWPAPGFSQDESPLLSNLGGFRCLGVYCALGVYLCFYSSERWLLGCVRSPCQGEAGEWLGKAERRSKKRTILIPPEPTAQVKWFTPGRRTLARLRGDFGSES